jgi:hypothetical protein
MNPNNERWEELMFQQNCNKASVGCYLCHLDGTFSRNMIMNKIVDSTQ